MHFRVADVLTGQPLTDLNPISWSIVDPLTGTGDATYTIPLPRTEAAREVLRSTIGKHDAVQIGVWDDQERFIFGGPVPTPAQYDPTSGQLTVKTTDWRAYFYTLVLRAGSQYTENNGDFIREDYEQTTAMWELMQAGVWISSLTPVVGCPAFGHEMPEASGITRDITFRFLENIGEGLDNISRRERGPEWWTEISYDSSTGVLSPQFLMAWPERSSRDEAFRIESVVRIEDTGSRGSNVTERVVWPEQVERRTRVYATGEGTHPDQVWALDQDPGLDLSQGQPLVLLREVVSGPFTGVKKKRTAFEHAFAQRTVLNAAAPVELRLRTDRLDLQPGEYAVGDRVDLYLEDEWQTREADDARIIQRTLDYTRSEGTIATLIVDVAGTEAIEE